MVSDKISKKGNFFNASISEVGLLAVLSASSYWLAFLYEAGYFQTFGIPLNLINLSLETILTAALGLLGLLFLFFAIGNIVSIFWPKNPALQTKFLRISVLLLIVLWHLYNYGLRKQDWILYLIVGVIFVVFEILWPILIHSDKKTLQEKFESDEISEEPARRKILFGRIFDFLGASWYLFFVILAICSLLSHSSGVAKAKTTKEYFVIQDTNLAVIKLYPEVIYTVPFNPTTKEVIPKLIILSTKNIDKVELYKKNIGPLNVISETEGGHANCLKILEEQVTLHNKIMREFWREKGSDSKNEDKTISKLQKELRDKYNIISLEYDKNECFKTTGELPLIQ